MQAGEAKFKRVVSAYERLVNKKSAAASAPAPASAGAKRAYEDPDSDYEDEDAYAFGFGSTRVCCTKVSSLADVLKCWHLQWLRRVKEW